MRLRIRRREIFFVVHLCGLLLFGPIGYADVQTPCAPEPAAARVAEGPCRGNLQLYALNGPLKLTNNSVGYDHDNVGFGRRFRPALNLFLKEEGAQLKLTLGDGSIRSFVSRSPGAFTSVRYPEDDRSTVAPIRGGYEQRFPDGRVFTYGPVSQGLFALQSIADLTGRLVTITRASENRRLITALEDAGRNVVTFQYTDGVVTKIVAPGSREYHLVYDNAKRLRRVTNPDFQTVQFVWDPADKSLITGQVNNGNALHFEYFAWGRDGILAAVISDSGRAQRYRYSRDMVTISNDSGEEQYTFVNGAWTDYASRNGRVQARWDPLGRPLEMKVDGAVTMRAVYPPITGGAYPPVSPPVKVETLHGTIDIAYNKDLLPISSSVGGVKSVVNYETIGAGTFLAGIKTGAISHEFGRNRVGLVTEERLNGLTVQNYRYDEAHRLSETVDINGTVAGLTYAPDGSIKALAVNGAVMGGSRGESLSDEAPQYSLPVVPPPNPPDRCLHGEICSARGPSFTPDFTDPATVPPAREVRESASYTSLSGARQSIELTTTISGDTVTQSVTLTGGGEGTQTISGRYVASPIGETVTTDYGAGQRCTMSRSGEGQSPVCSLASSLRCDTVSESRGGPTTKEVESFNSSPAKLEDPLPTAEKEGSEILKW